MTRCYSCGGSGYFAGTYGDIRCEDCGGEGSWEDDEDCGEKPLAQFNAEHPEILEEIRAELRDSLIEFQLRKRPDGRYEVAA